MAAQAFLVKEKSLLAQIGEAGQGKEGLKRIFRLRREWSAYKYRRSEERTFNPFS